MDELGQLQVIFTGVLAMLAKHVVFTEAFVRVSLSVRLVVSADVTWVEMCVMVNRNISVSYTHLTLPTKRIV